MRAKEFTEKNSRRCIDFAKGTIRVYRQFVRIASGPDKGKMMFTSLKNHKERTIHPAPSVMDA